MTRRRSAHPEERMARRYRRAQEYYDRVPYGRFERGGFGRPEGYRGSYSNRPGYWLRRGELYPPEPEGSGWPHRLHHIDRLSEERHLRAYRDRDLARSVDAALYQSLGPEADEIATYANDAVITLEGTVADPVIAREALEVAWQMPGVYRVRNALRWRR